MTKHQHNRVADIIAGALERLRAGGIDDGALAAAAIGAGVEAALADDMQTPQQIANWLRDVADYLERPDRDSLPTPRLYQ
jgi:hypothetical protein